MTVKIDIKPGSYPNCVNINGHGTIPIAVLGGKDLDVSQIDRATLNFAGLHIRIKGNGTPQCAVEDISGDLTSPEGAPDGYLDLVCHFQDDPDAWAPAGRTASLTGTLLDGTLIAGTDEICLRPGKIAATTLDLNGDERVDILDLVVVASQFGAMAPQPAAADLNEDGVVDILDIALIGASFEGQ